MMQERMELLEIRLENHKTASREETILLKEDNQANYVDEKKVKELIQKGHNIIISTIELLDKNHKDAVKFQN